MANEPRQDVGALAQASDMSKLPLYGTSDVQYEELKQAQQDALAALEQRYAQPNWFKVAAGFAKPQLGGFLASLGSASEALGENIEQARAQQLPISQMRAQLAQTNLLLSKNKEVSDSITEWQAQHPGQTPPADLIAKWQAYAPHSPTVKALTDQQSVTQKQQEQVLQWANTQRATLLDMYKRGQINQNQLDEGNMQVFQRLNQIMPPAPPLTGEKKDGAEPPKPEDKSAMKPAEEKKDLLAPEIKPSFTLPHNRPPEVLTESEKLANKTMLDAAEHTNAAPKKHFEMLQIINDPQNYPVAEEANKNIIKMARQNPELFLKVTNLIRQQGGMAALLEKGLSINWNGYGVNIGIPISAAMEAELGSKGQAFRDTLMNNLATSAYYGLMAKGIDPSKAGEGKFSQLIAQEMHIDKNPKAIVLQTQQNIEALKHAKNLYGIYTDLLPELAARGNLSPHHDIQKQSKAYADEMKIYQGVIDGLNSDYQKRLSKKSQGIKP